MLLPPSASGVELGLFPPPQASGQEPEQLQVGKVLVVFSQGSMQGEAPQDTGQLLDLYGHWDSATCVSSGAEMMWSTRTWLVLIST